MQSYHEENILTYGTILFIGTADGRKGGHHPQSGPHVLVGWHDES
jgi:hypothetical protein